MLEVADLFVVNKSDRPGAQDVRRDLDLMLDLSHMTGQESDTGYRPPIIMASALNGDGTAEVWDATAEHLAHLEQTGLRASRRNHRLRTEVRARLEYELDRAADAALESAEGIELLTKTEGAELAPNEAGIQLADVLLQNRKEKL